MATSRRWTRSGVWYRLNAALVIQVRTQQGRESQPSATIIDSQSVKTSEGGEERGVDVYKQAAGRKRHFVVDTLGLLQIVVVHSASLQDGSGGKLVLQKLFDLIKHSVYNRYCRLKLLWVDAAYEGIREYVRKKFGWKLEIVRRFEGVKGFKVLPHRWIVETFYQAGKEYLGLDEYHMRDAEAIRKHWCLVFVAHSLLHLDCLPA